MQTCPYINFCFYLQSIELTTFLFVPRSPSSYPLSHPTLPPSYALSHLFSYPKAKSLPLPQPPSLYFPIIRSYFPHPGLSLPYFYSHLNCCNPISSLGPFRYVLGTRPQQNVLEKSSRYTSVQIASTVKCSRYPFVQI